MENNNTKEEITDSQCHQLAAVINAHHAQLTDAINTLLGTVAQLKCDVITLKQDVAQLQSEIYYEETNNV